MLTKEEIRGTALNQSAADHGCSPEDFAAEDLRIFPAGIRPGARVWVKQPAILDVTTYGTNAVITCREELTEGVRSLFAPEPEFWQLFAAEGITALNGLLAALGARMRYMTCSFLPDPDELARFGGSCPFRVRLLGEKDFQNLYRPEWSDALSPTRKELDRIAAGAYDGDKLVGLAGASEDCRTMWQIGINVLPAYRNQGTAAVLVNLLAREILEEGIVPFYSAVWANVRSVKTAVRAGFRSAWASMSAAECKSE
jgi:GNAT superfamily N-acetyltransferase